MEPTESMCRLCWAKQKTTFLVALSVPLAKDGVAKNMATREKVWSSGEEARETSLQSSSAVAQLCETDYHLLLQTSEMEHTVKAAYVSGLSHRFS